MDLIMCCLNNNPQRRPRAVEIVGRMVGVVLEHPPSFENRVEMLRRVSALLTEKRELEEEVVRKDSATQEKAGEIEALAEEKKPQEEESENTCAIKAAKIAQLETEVAKIITQVEQEQTFLAEKDTCLADKNSIIVYKDSMLASKDTSLQKNKTTIQSLNNQLTKTRDYLTSKPQVSSSAMSLLI